MQYKSELKKKKHSRETGWLSVSRETSLDDWQVRLDKHPLCVSLETHKTGIKTEAYIWKLLARW